jgi:hypothetical protein
MNLSVSPDLFSLRELPAKASSLGVEETADTSATLPVSPALTTPVNNKIVNNQMAAANTLGARYLGGINYNRMNTAQKADYADRVFKTTV